MKLVHISYVAAFCMNFYFFTKRFLKDTLNRIECISNYAKTIEKKGLVPSCLPTGAKIVCGCGTLQRENRYIGNICREPISEKQKESVTGLLVFYLIPTLL